jgi:8-oxo-dGTP pyrophosphatase MutT (NUDIX family)
MPGMDVGSLLTHLEAGYPGADECEHLAVELEFIGEPPQSPRQSRSGREPRVSIVVRNNDGEVLLAGQGGSFDAAGLPGGPLTDGEHPREAASRLAQELFGASGLDPVPLAVDLEIAGTCGGLRGEFVFDAGVLETGQLTNVTAPSGTGAARFVAPQELPHLVSPRGARVIAAALDQLGGRGAALLEHGYLPGQRPVFEWHEGGDLPPGMPVTQAGVWAFDRDGRVLLQHRVERRDFALPAGRPEPGDRNLLATAAREAFEESQILIDQRGAVTLGYQVCYDDPEYPKGLVQVRYAALILGYYPIGPDADPELRDSRSPYRRFLVDSRRAADLLDYGPNGDGQARAAERAALEMGVPAHRPAADGYRDHGDPGLDAVAPVWELML